MAEVSDESGHFGDSSYEGKLERAALEYAFLFHTVLDCKQLPKVASKSSSASSSSAAAARKGL